ncbi:MAG: FlgD immunoglobulin-like domain containing protein [Candidatus Latescibacterota bacterium]
MQTFRDPPANVLLAVTEGEDQVTAVAEEAGARPAATGLEAAYPNPFNSATVLRFSLAEAGGVRLTVYDALGQRVRLLVDEPRAAGAHRVTWDGRDQQGRAVASGVYVARMLAGRRTWERSVVLAR